MVLQKYAEEKEMADALGDQHSADNAYARRRHSIHTRLHSRKAVEERGREHQKTLQESSEDLKGESEMLETTKAEATTMSIMPVDVEGVHGYTDALGVVWLKLEDCARGLGITQNKGGVEYVRWERVVEYLRQIKFSPHLGKTRQNMYITESTFYRLAMRVDNPVAEAFQNKLAYDILPKIRKHGMYMTPETIENVLHNPDLIIEMARRLKEEKAKTAALTQAIQTLEPKANYCDVILACPDTVPITQIAKDYGMTGQAFNALLHDLKIQFKLGGTWVLYAAYADKGYTQSKTFHKTDKRGVTRAYTNTEWTQTGRMFLYNYLRKRDIYPTIEKLRLEEEERIEF